MQMAGGGGSFLGAAQQGMFAVDTASADEMIKAIAQMQESLNNRLLRISDLKQQAMLGDLPEAQGIAELDTLVASGDQQSLEFVLRRFQEALDEVHQALEISMRTYEQADGQAAQGFRIGEE